MISISTVKMKEIVGEYLKQFNSKNTKSMYEVHLNQYFKIIDTNPNTYFDNGRDYEADVRKYSMAISDKSPKSQKSLICKSVPESDAEIDLLLICISRLADI